MFRKQSWIIALAGLLAGLVTGLFGAGGGMILVPLLSFSALGEAEIFPASISIILPVCVVCLVVTGLEGSWKSALPYLIGSGLGGFAAGKWGRHIPTLWLHRGLGLLILWGGFRYLC